MTTAIDVRCSPRYGRRFLAIGLAAFLLSVQPVAALAWSHTTQDGNAFFIGNETAAACGATVHLLWKSFGTSHVGRVVYRRSTDGGATWRTKVTLAQEGQPASVEGQRDPTVLLENVHALAVGCSASTVIAVFENWHYGDARSELWIRRSTDGGSTWRAAVKIASYTVKFGGTSLAISGSRVTLGWTEPGGNLVIRQSADAGASFAAKRSIGSTNMKDQLIDNGRNGYLTLAASGTGLYAAWVPRCFSASICANFGHGFVVRVSHNGGATFGTKHVLTVEGVQARAPAGFVANGSTVLLEAVAGGDDLVVFRSSDSGVGFGRVVIRPGSAGFMLEGDLAFSGSTLRASYGVPGGGRVVTSLDGGATWSRSERAVGSARDDAPDTSVALPAGVVIVLASEFTSGGSRVVSGRGQ